MWNLHAYPTLTFNWPLSQSPPNQLLILPYFFTYKPTSAISRDPKSYRPSNRLVLSKRKRKTIGYKPRAKFLIVTGHLSERASRRSSYTMAFRIKVVVEAEAIENSSEIAWDYGLNESMVRRWRRDQATILSGKLKMSARRAKMSRFTPKCPELDEQAMEWFSRKRDQIFYL